MSPPSGSNGASQCVPDLPQRKWTGAHALGLVHEVNERCIEVLAGLAADRAGCGFEFVTSTRSLWRSLDASARRRAAECPFLLVDVRFQNVEWWRWAKQHRTGHGKGMVRDVSFPPKPAGELMRQTLMLAWHSTRTDRRAACLLLGAVPAVAALIADLGLQDIERIASKHSRHLRPRWEDHWAFWRNLLLAARSGDTESLFDLHLHGLQLLGSELIPDQK